MVNRKSNVTGEISTKFTLVAVTPEKSVMYTKEMNFIEESKNKAPNFRMLNFYFRDIFKKI